MIPRFHDGNVVNIVVRVLVIATHGLSLGAGYELPVRALNGGAAEVVDD